MGVAAHIEGATQNTARYNSELSIEQLRDIDNAIWLCQTHGKEIDNDEAAHPVDLLRRWKSEAEAEATANLGKPVRIETHERLLERAFENALANFPKIKDTLDLYRELSLAEKADLYERVYQHRTNQSTTNNPYKQVCDGCRKMVLPTKMVHKSVGYRPWKTDQEKSSDVRVCDDCASPENWPKIERALHDQLLEKSMQSKPRRL